MKALEILEEARAAGVRLVLHGDRIAATPPGRLSEPLKALIRDHKGELLELLACEVRSGEPTVRGPSSGSLQSLRRFCPSLWCNVATTDGRNGVLWGVSPYGVAVWFDPKGPIYTLDSADVSILPTDGEGSKRVGG